MKLLNLTNSRPLDVHKWSQHPRIRQITHTIYSEIKDLPKKPSDQVKLKKMLRVLLIDLFVAYKEDPTLYIAYSRRKADYTDKRDDKNNIIKSRYRALYIKYAPLKRAIEHLIQYEYIEHHMGFYDKSKGAGKQSRMRASQRLISIFKRRIINRYAIGNNKEYELIRLNNKAKGKKYSVEYTDTPETHAMRNNVKRINYYLSQFNINLHLSNKEEEKLEFNVPFTQKSLYRVFNNGSFESGGRFYGGWWLSLPNREEKLRQFITINEEHTVELDYSCMHISMLYSKKKLSLSGDAYTLEGYPSKSRKLIKSTFNAMINAKSNKLSSKKFDLSLLPEGKTFNDLKSDILAKHKPIAEYFFSGIGIKLQLIDSNIAESVMLRVLNELNYEDRKDIVLLPVHDSFIISTKNAYLLAELTDIMKEEFCRIVKNVSIEDVFIKAEKIKKGSPYKEFQTNYYKKMGIKLPATQEQEAKCLKQYQQEYSNYLKRNQEWESFIKVSSPQF